MLAVAVENRSQVLQGPNDQDLSKGRLIWYSRGWSSTSTNSCWLTGGHQGLSTIFVIEARDSLFGITRLAEDRIVEYRKVEWLTCSLGPCPGTSCAKIVRW